MLCSYPPLRNLRHNNSKTLSFSLFKLIMSSSALPTSVQLHAPSSNAPKQRPDTRPQFLSSTSHITDVLQQTIELTTCQKISRSFPILHPFGRFKRTWDSIILIVCIFSAIEIPFSLAFQVYIDKSTLIGCIALIVDLVLCIDVFLKFRTAYFDRFDPLQLITSPKHIAKKYLKTRFCYEFPTALPIEFLLCRCNTALTTTTDVLRILKVLARIVMMKRLYSLKVNRWSGELSQVMYIRMISVLLGMLLGAHYLACVWWATGNMMMHHGFYSWITISLETFDNGDPLETFEAYSYSYYWSIITLFTTGYGDITAKNIVECWVSLFCVIAGTVYISYLIGLFTAFVAEREGDVQHIENEKLKRAKLFCRHYHLSQALGDAMESHLKYHHNYNFVVGAESEILDDLPTHLRSRIETEIASKTLKDIDFLSDFLPLPLIGQIALKMRSISCNAGHWLYRKNEFGDELYIQRTGVSMMYHHKTQPTNCKTKRGDVLGEECLVHSKRKHSLRCMTWSEFYCLKKSDIQSVVMDNFKNGHKIWNKMRLKIKQSFTASESNGYPKLRNLREVYRIGATVKDFRRMKSRKMIHGLSHKAFEMQSVMAFDPIHKGRERKSAIAHDNGMSMNPLSVVDEDGYVLMTAAENSTLRGIDELAPGPCVRTTTALSMSTAADRNQEVLDRSAEDLWECVEPESLWGEDKVIETDESSQGSEDPFEHDLIPLKRSGTKTSFL